MAPTSVGDPAIKRSSCLQVLDHCFGSNTILLSFLDRFPDTSCNSLLLHCKLVVVRPFGKWIKALHNGFNVHIMNGANEADVGHFPGE